MKLYRDELYRSNTINIINSLPINFNEKFEKFSEYWTPKLLMKFNDYYIKAAKMKGEFVWQRMKIQINYS